MTVATAVVGPRRGPLENTAKSAANLAPTERSARTPERIKARAVLRDLTRVDRLRRCGLALGQEVRVRGAAGPHGAGVSGLATCGSVWSCPCCSAKINLGRSTDTETGIRVWSTMGGSFVLMTLTQRHRKGQALADLWDALSDSWRRMVGQRAWKEGLASAGVEGYHRTTEVTVGAHGWHVHLHVLMFVRAGVDQEAVRAFGARALDLWTVAVAERPVMRLDLATGRRHRWRESTGFTAVRDAQDWKVLHGTADALAGVAGYVHKGEYREVERAPRTAAQVAMEVSRADLKSARGGSRTPFGVLADLVAGLEDWGDAVIVDDADLALWREWEAASAGRRQQVWSQGMRDTLGLGAEATDEELAEEGVDGPDLVVIRAEDWHRFDRKRGAHAELIAAINASAAGGFLAQRLAAAEVLRRYGCDFTLCAPPGAVASTHGTRMGAGRVAGDY